MSASDIRVLIPPTRCAHRVGAGMKKPGAQAGWRHTRVTCRISSTSLYSAQRKKRALCVRSSFGVIARSKATKQSTIHPHKAGLLRCARNDEARVTVGGV